MPHYICKGENCKTISERPSVCLEPGCVRRYKLLHECECSHKDNHIEITKIPFIKHTKVKEGSIFKINPVSFGLSFGFLVGFYFFSLGIFASYFGVGEGLVESLKVLYIGYDATFLGSVAGGLWGVVDGFIGGVVIAYFYNFIQKIRVR